MLWSVKRKRALLTAKLPSRYRLGLGAEQAKPAKLSATEQKLQASVLRDKAKAASASAPKANGHSKQREDSSDDEDSRAGAIKSRANLASSRLDAFTKQKKKAKSDTPTPSIPVASTSKLPEVQSGMKITGIQSNGADTNDATVRSNKKRKRSSQEADTSKETRATQDEDSVLGFPPEPSDVDMNADESNTGPIKGPYRPPSDSDDDQDPSANISMNSIPSGHHDDSKLDSKQKKRKRAKQRRAERRKAARMSLGSQPDTLQ